MKWGPPFHLKCSHHKLCRLRVPNLAEGSYYLAANIATVFQEMVGFCSWVQADAKQERVRVFKPLSSGGETIPGMPGKWLVGEATVYMDSRPMKKDVQGAMREVYHLLDYKQSMFGSDHLPLAAMKLVYAGK